MFGLSYFAGETATTVRQLVIYIVFFALWFIANPAAFGQNTDVSGVINSYARVLDIDSCENTLFMSTSTGFAVGDRILIIQMKGASVDGSNTPNFGDIINYGNAGNFEFNYIESMSGLFATLRYRMIQSYDVAGSVQVVKVPQYRSVTVVGTVRPMPWNGRVGGVVVFEATDTIRLRSAVDASGMGFRGGDSSNNAGDPNKIDLYYHDSTYFGGYKGESIADLMPGKELGRGANSGGGGGGNSQNAGGGGGANFGRGGVGGDQVDIVTQVANGGSGGKNLAYITKTKTFLGSGGGGGHCNDTRGSSGAAGGGLIMINSPVLMVEGGKLISNGATARTAGSVDGSDGSGGGGSGGTVMVAVPIITGALTIDLYGGKGGDNSPPSTPTWCYAPGGGGGGGLAWLPTGIVATVNSLGGSAGIVTNPALPCFNMSYGADSGMSGGIIFDPIFPAGTTPFSRPVVDSRLKQICAGDSTVLTAGGGLSYLWSPNTGLDDAMSPSPKASPQVTTTYKVSITGVGNCVYLDSTIVVVSTPPQLSITGSARVCGNSITGYKAAAIPGYSYQWSANRGVIISGQGTDSVSIRWDNHVIGTVVLSAIPDTLTDCPSVDSLSITIIPTTKPDITGVKPLCIGDTLTLQAPTGFVGYFWSTGETTRSIQVWDSDTVWVQLFGGECTIYSDTFNIQLIPQPQPIIITNLDTIVSPCDVASLTVNAGYSAYLWSTGDTTQSISTRDSGWYVVTVTDTAGCSGTDSTYIARQDNGPVKFVIALDTLYGNTGDKVYFPLKILSSNNTILNCEGEYTVTVHFNRTLLVPEQPFISSTLLPRKRYVTFGNTFTISNEPLTQLPGIMFTATLGDTSETQIVIDSFTWHGFEIDYEAHNGLFVTRDICYEGGSRFTDSSDGLVSLIAPRPNPASGIVSIEYSTIEIGRTRLLITDLTGAVIAVLADGEHQRGGHLAKFNTNRISNGRYFITLQTPTALMHQALIIDH